MELVYSIKAPILPVQTGVRPGDMAIVFPLLSFKVKTEVPASFLWLLLSCFSEKCRIFSPSFNTE